MVVHLVCLLGVEDTVQGPTELYMPLPTRGPRASCSLGRSGYVQRKLLLGSQVQLSHEPRGVVAITMPATGPAWRKKHGCVCRMSPHYHSTVFVIAHENVGEMWEGVYVYETRETK